MKLFKKFMFLSVFMVLILSFQNCGPAFKVVTEEQALKNLADSHENPHVLKKTESQVTAAQDITYGVYMATDTMSYSWSYKLDGVAANCTEIKGNTGAEYVVNCTKVGYLSVKVTIEDKGVYTSLPEYIYDLSNTITPAETVNFNIKSGTNNKAWNNANETIEAFVGQKLILKNDDTTKHNLHTNGFPCEHGSDFMTGQSYTCSLGKAYSRAANGRIYDHNLPSISDFYVTVYDGGKLYQQNCAFCHDATGGKKITGFSPNDFFEAARFIEDMKGIDTKLTGKQIEAIAFYLRVK